MAQRRLLRAGRGAFWLGAGVGPRFTRPVVVGQQLRFGEAGAPQAALEARQGVKLLKLPVQPHIKTLDISLLDMEAGSRRSVVRSTASRVLAVIKGSGTMRMGETEIHWNAGDVMAVPCWCAHEIVADQPARFLEVCDEPTMRALGFYREAQA